MLLSWNNTGKYQARLENRTDPLVIIRVDDKVGGEIVLYINNDGVIDTKNQQAPVKANLKISSKSPMTFTFREYYELIRAISEARDFLRKLKKRGKVIHLSNGDNKSYCGLKKDNKTWIAKSDINCKSCLRLSAKKGLPL